MIVVGGGVGGGGQSVSSQGSFTSQTRLSLSQENQRERTWLSLSCGRIRALIGYSVASAPHAWQRTASSERSGIWDARHNSHLLSDA